MDPARPSAKSLAVLEGKILEVGDEDAVMHHRGPETVVLDLEGRTVSPGFVDHHVHLLNVGFSLMNAETGESLFMDLTTIRSLEELERRVREKAAGLPEGTWILGSGWSQGFWGSEALPAHHPLTRAAPRHPVYFSRIDGHAGWVNGAAMAQSGIDARTPDPAGGSIDRLPSGEPSGILLERANEIVLRHLPSVPDQTIRRAFDLGARSLAAQGVSEVFDAGFLSLPGIVNLEEDFGRMLELLRRQDEEEPLPVRVNLMAPAPSRLAETIIRAPDKYRRLSPRLRVTHLKLFADGALGSRGAALAEPYADDAGNTGICRMTREEIHRQAEAALAAGLDVATHAIGDGAIRRTLDVYEELSKKIPGLNPRRLRIEHFSYAREEDIRRAAVLGIVLSVQPDFVLPDDTGRTMEDSRLGPERSAGAYAWATGLEMGALLAGGSDYFTTPAAPLLHFYSAVTRRNANGLPPDGWHPKERLSREDAFRLMTRPIQAGGSDAAAGILKPGAPANLIVLSSYPAKADATEILEIAVHATFLDGKLVYSDASLPLFRK